MTNNQYDYHQKLQEDLARHRNQHQITLALNHKAVKDEKPLPASVRLYNRLRGSEPNLNFEPRPPEQPKPESFYHQRTFYERSVQSQQLRSNDHIDHMEAICSEAPFPANMLESYRNRDHERRIEANLSPVRPQQREAYSKLKEELISRSGSLNSIAFEVNRLNPMQGLSQLCENEQKFYDEIFKKVIDSESTRCKESGEVLKQIRQSYQEMFLAIPHYIKTAQESTQHVDNIVAQLEHQTELNRELEARMSLLESGQEIVQLERESWTEEKQRIMDDQSEFQKNFLQLRNFWESERNRYEQELLQLKSTLQEQPYMNVSSKKNAFSEKLESIMNSVFDLVENAPDFGDTDDIQYESDNNIQANAEAFDSISTTSGKLDNTIQTNAEAFDSISATSGKPATEHTFMSERIALTSKIQNSDMEEVGISSPTETSEPLCHPRDVTLISNSKSPCEDFTVNRIANDDSVSFAQEPIYDRGLHSRDGYLVSDSTTIINESIKEACKPDPFLDHPDVTDSVLSDRECQQHSKQLTDLEFDPDELEDSQDKCPFSSSRSSPDTNEVHSDSQIREFCEDNEQLDFKSHRHEEESSAFPEQKKQFPEFDQNMAGGSSELAMPMETSVSEHRENENGKSDTTIVEPTEISLDRAPSQAEVDEKNIDRFSFRLKSGERLQLDKTRVEHIQKERQMDLDFIESFGRSSLQPRSLLSSRLSNWSFPGCHESKATSILQSSRQPSAPRFSARSASKQKLSCRPYLRTSLENLLVRAEHHRNLQTMTEPNLLKIINFILDSCYAATIAKKEKKRIRMFAIELKLYTIGLLKEQHGLDEIVLAKWCEMMNSIRKYRPANTFVDLFADLLDTESELYVHILLRIRQILFKSRYGISVLVHDRQFISQDRALDVIRTLFSDFIATSSYKSTTALISQGCRPWAHIIHDFGPLDTVRKSQILSPRLNLTLMDVINPHDKRFNCHECGIDVNRFISLAYVGIRRAELEYERDRWARRVFQSVDSNNDHFISFDQFSRAFTTNTIPRLSDRQLRVLFDRMNQEAATQQMSLDRFRLVCSQLTHAMFVKPEARIDSDDRLRQVFDCIIEKWTRLDPAYNKFVELMCNTESGFDICQRLSYARLMFEGALIYGSTSSKIIDKYRAMLGIIAEQEPDKSVSLSSTSLIQDISRLEQMVDQRLVALISPGSTRE